MASHSRRWTLLFLASLTVVYGCALVPERFWPPDAPASTAAPADVDPLDQGAAAVQAGDYGAASERFRQLASRCESGATGRQAVLLLAVAALDPRNPAASPDSAAALAAHFLMLPGTQPEDRATAETLYLAALNQGAAPPFDAAAEGRIAFQPALATQYENCGEVEVPNDTVRSSLPTLPGPGMAARLDRLQAVRDSLVRQVTGLEAELERIRSLLRQGILPDTSGTR